MSYFFLPLSPPMFYISTVRVDNGEINYNLYVLPSVWRPMSIARFSCSGNNTHNGRVRYRVKVQLTRQGQRKRPAAV